MITLGVAAWAFTVPFGRRMPDSLMRGVTVFGGAFLLAVCCLDLLPEVAEAYGCHEGERQRVLAMAPFVAILVGFLVQQLLESLSAHVEHGHIEDGDGHHHQATLLGLVLGLSLHALLEGMPLVSQDFTVDRGLAWGIVIHNIPVALILVGLMVDRGYGFWRVLLLLTLFGAMSPLGSLLKIYVLRPNDFFQHILIGLVVGVLLHVGSSILFDHKRNHFSWLNVGLTTAAFLLAAVITLKIKLI